MGVARFAAAPAKGDFKGKASRKAPPERSKSEIESACHWSSLWIARHRSYTPSTPQSDCIASLYHSTQSTLHAELYINLYILYNIIRYSIIQMTCNVLCPHVHSLRGANGIVGQVQVDHELLPLHKGQEAFLAAAHLSKSQAHLKATGLCEAKASTVRVICEATNCTPASLRLLSERFSSGTEAPGHMPHAPSACVHACSGALVHLALKQANPCHGRIFLRTNPSNQASLCH